MIGSKWTAQDVAVVIAATCGLITTLTSSVAVLFGIWNKYRIEENAQIAAAQLTETTNNTVVALALKTDDQTATLQTDNQAIRVEMQQIYKEMNGMKTALIGAAFKDGLQEGVRQEKDKDTP